MITDFKWHRRAQRCIGQASLTNSKRPESLVKGVYPTHLTRGFGARVWDHTDKSYVDYICGLGTNLLGYADERVCRAQDTQARKGLSLSLSNTLEVTLGEKLKQLFTFADRFKFLKTGSEACSAAIRMARAHTGRDVVMSQGYHGWSDEFVSLTPPAIGVPQRYDRDGQYTGYIAPCPVQISPKGWDLSCVAAVIVEPVVTDWSKERRLWLNELREACTKSGAVLIFDEIITGYRWPEFSVAGHWDITPDLICIGKAMANGAPLAAVAGRADILDGNYFVSSTYAGESASLAAALEVAETLLAREDISRLWESGKMWLEWFNALIPGLRIEGYPTRGRLVAESDMQKAIFLQEACIAGALFGPSWFWNFPLMKEEGIKVAIEAVARKIKAGGVTLRGELPTSPFAERTRHG